MLSQSQPAGSPMTNLEILQNQTANIISNSNAFSGRIWNLIDRLEGARTMKAESAGQSPAPTPAGILGQLQENITAIQYYEDRIATGLARLEEMI